VRQGWDAHPVSLEELTLAYLREPGAEEAPGSSRAKDSDLHFCMNCSATKRRWILPVGVFGIASTK
jgi:hypothetical protein